MIVRMAFNNEQIKESLVVIKIDLETQIRSENEGKGINMGDIIKHCDELINRVGNSSLSPTTKKSLVQFAHAPWTASGTLDQIEFHLKELNGILEHFQKKSH